MKCPEVFLLSVVVALLYYTLYGWAVSVDKGHCTNNKLYYGGTNPVLVAHCVTPQGVRIPASVVGTDEWKKGTY